MNILEILNYSMFQILNNIIYFLKEYSKNVKSCFEIIKV